MMLFSLIPDAQSMMTGLAAWLCAEINFLPGGFATLAP